jgi:hypothetical protein
MDFYRSGRAALADMPGSFTEFRGIVAGYLE